MNRSMAPPSVPAPDAGIEPDQVMLVLTDGRRRGRSALTMPFASVTVITADTGRIPPDVSGPFDTVVIERSTFEPREIDGSVQATLPVLRPGGRLLVVLDYDQRGTGSTQEVPHLSGLRWSGLARMNDRPCAVMTADASPTLTPTPATDPTAVAAPPGLLLASLAGVLRIAEENHAVTRAALARARTAFADEIDDRHRSERQLLDQLATLVDELERTRQQLTGAKAVRMVLGQSRPGRAAIRALRPAWRLARSVGRRIRPSTQG